MSDERIRRALSVAEIARQTVALYDVDKSKMTAAEFLEKSRDEVVKRLKTAIEIVRMYPDFDEDGPIPEMLDACLAGNSHPMIDHIVNIDAAALSDWERLKDPQVLHLNLLRGFPARLTIDMCLHLAGQKYQEMAATIKKLEDRILDLELQLEDERVATVEAMFPPNDES